MPIMPLKMTPLEAITKNVLLINEKIRREQRYKNQIRQWATPFTIGTFLLTALTGILLFFKVSISLAKPAHEWLSWLLVISTLFHLYVNWGSSLHPLSYPAGKRILGFFLLLICIAILFPGGTPVEKHSSNRLADALIQAPLSTITLLTHHTADETVTILRTHGVNPISMDQTIQEIAKDNDSRAMDVLTLLF